ncbi:hypothetical protein SDC9_154970 [bioreactor metagenome]|uniref:Uncharacterized protein n=1 Tax=bioreactor metagenome TaxID=1076179 RepID=A0A645F2Q6_9ZZZZ
MNFCGALHGVLRSVDEVGDQDVAGLFFQGGRHDQKVGHQAQRAPFAVLVADHHRAGGDVGVEGEFVRDLVAHGLSRDVVVGGKKRLAVVALRRKPGRQQRIDQLVGVHSCGLAEHLDRGIIQADLVVLDRVAGHADRQLEVLVLDAVIRAGQVLDFAVADPLAHTGDVAQPRIGFDVGRAGHDRRDALIGGLLPLERFRKQGVEGDVDTSQSLGIDNHD